MAFYEVSNPTWVAVAEQYVAGTPPYLRTGITVNAAATSAQTATLRIKEFARSLPPKTIRIYQNIPVFVGNKIVVTVTDTAGDAVTVDPVEVAGTGTLVESTFTLDTTSSVFTNGSEYIISATVTLNPGNVGYLHWLKVDTSPYPS